MTRREAMAGLEVLARHFTEPPLDEERARAYLAHLTDLTFAEWDRAVTLAFRTLERPFFPTVATLRRLAGRLLSWGDVYERLVMLMRRFPVSAPPARMLHPFDALVIRRLGGWQRLTSGDDDTWIRRDIERDADGWQQAALQQGIAIPQAFDALPAPPKGSYAVLETGEPIALNAPPPPALEGPVAEARPRKVTSLLECIGKTLPTKTWRPERPTAESPTMTDEQIAARKVALAAQARMLARERTA